ncbi:MAG: fimbrillin family protein [Bacteroides sp.]|nr:fimbrillin family protein [Bacteroides sp.]
MKRQREAVTPLSRERRKRASLRWLIPCRRRKNSQVDLLAAVPLMNQGHADNGGTVKFLLKHTMTKVSVYVKSNDNVTGKKVTAFSITSAKSGTLIYHAPDAGNVDDAGTSWTYPNPVATETFMAATSDFNVPSSTTVDAVRLATFFLLPRGEGSTFSITYIVPGTTSTGAAITQSITLTGQPLPSLDKWTQGASMTYTIGIEKKKITVTAATHPTWNNNELGTIAGSVIITNPVSPDNPEWLPDNSEQVDGTE